MWAHPALAQMPMEGMERLDRTMFWTGAMFALTPIIIALTVLGVVFWHRRKRAQQDRDRP